MGSTITMTGVDAVKKTKVTVFYDGSCPLCRKEIRHYRRLDKSRNIVWCDISREAGRLAVLDIPLEQAMQELHVVDIDGQVHTRAAAFVILWQQLPFYRSLAAITIRFRLLPVMNAVYDVFARWRFRRWQARQCERL